MSDTVNQGIENFGLTLIQCAYCGNRFFLGDAPGAAGITPDGQFVGRCPQCDHRHGMTMTHKPVPEYRVTVGNSDSSVKFAKD